MKSYEPLRVVYDPYVSNLIERYKTYKQFFPIATFFVARWQYFMNNFCIFRSYNEHFLNPVLKSFPEISNPTLLLASVGIINFSGLRSKVQKPKPISGSVSRNMKQSSETTILERQPVILEKTEFNFKRKTVQIALYADCGQEHLNAGNVYRNMFTE